MEAEKASREGRPSGEVVPLLGYGSLTSGLGLGGLRPLRARRLGRVRLLNCRRGFGKLSQHGDRLAMVLEPLRDGEPIRGEPLDAELDETGTCPEALLLALDVDDLARVARREGYRPEALALLSEQARNQGAALPEYLWTFLVGASFDIAAYRRELARRVAYTSPHYIPHPVPLADGTVALTFLAPGAEGSGSPDVVPLRVACGSTEVLPMAAAWRRRPNPSQLEYFFMCLLAGVHNLSFADVVDELAEEPELGRRLAELGREQVAGEPARFCEALCLSRADYDGGFGLGPERPSFLRLCFPWYEQG